jgi:hypothetical protein
MTKINVKDEKMAQRKRRKTETEKNKRHTNVKKMSFFFFTTLLNDPCECPNNPKDPNSSNINLSLLVLMLSSLKILN